MFVIEGVQPFRSTIYNLYKQQKQGSQPAEQKGQQGHSTTNG